LVGHRAERRNKAKKERPAGIDCRHINLEDEKLEEFDFERFDETIKRVVSDDDVSSVLIYEQIRGAMEAAGAARLQLW
jgi:hypothetical protein